MAESLKVYIIEDGMNRLKDKTRTAAQKAVEAELKLLTDASKNKKVKAGFQVSWGKTRTEVKSPGPTDFVVYLVPGRDADFALELAKKHVRIEKEHDDKVRK
jgi:hypothetical protein